MTIDALGGATALTSSLAALTRAAPDRARPDSPEPRAAENQDRANQSSKTIAEAVAEKPDRTEVEARDDKAQFQAKSAKTESATHLSILYDKDIDLFISRQVDPDSGEVVRQYPYEDHLERLRSFAAQDRAKSEESVDVKV